MGSWLDPLLYFAAEAAARHNWRLAAQTLDTFSTCVRLGAYPQVRTQVRHSPALVVRDRMQGI
jgi:hypothetical protein